MGYSSDQHIYDSEEQYYSSPTPPPRYEEPRPAACKRLIAAIAQGMARAIDSAVAISDWLDEHLFPERKKQANAAQAQRRERQRLVEENATVIAKCISSCQTLGQCCRAQEMIINFRHRHGRTPQVEGWCGSLSLQVRKKQADILRHF